MASVCVVSAITTVTALLLGRSSTWGTSAAAAGASRRATCVEQIAEGLAAAHADHGGDRRLVDHRRRARLGGGVAGDVARQLVEFRGDLLQVVPDRALEQLCGFRRDGGAESRVGVVRDPPHHTVFRERRELERAGPGPLLQRPIGLGPRRRHEHEHRVGGRPGQVPVEALAGVLLQRPGVAQHHHPSLGEHRRRPEERFERLGVDCRRPARLEVEVARGRVDGGVDQQADGVLLLVVVVAVEEVDRRERARLERAFSALCEVLAMTAERNAALEAGVGEGRLEGWTGEAGGRRGTDEEGEDGEGGRGGADVMGRGRDRRT
jgi:hypothetical protein